MAYAEQWAERIYSQHLNSCTRARNTQKCILYVAEHTYHRIIPAYDLEHLLKLSLQRKVDFHLWNIYKRLVKKQPLDRVLLDKVTNVVLFHREDSFLQAVFDFHT